MTTKEPLTSLARQRREKDTQDERIRQNKKFKNNLMGIPQNQFNQSTAATTDLHMREALSKVREKDDVSIPHSLSRFHGTTIYQKPDRGS